LIELVTVRLPTINVYRRKSVSGSSVGHVPEPVFRPRSPGLAATKTARLQKPVCSCRRSAQRWPRRRAAADGCDNRRIALPPADLAVAGGPFCRRPLRSPGHHPYLRLGGPFPTGCFSWTCRQSEGLGGNLTGTTTSTLEIGSLRLQRLHGIVPSATKFALLINPTSPSLASAQVRDLQAAARSLCLEIELLRVSNDPEVDAAFAALTTVHVGGLLISADSFLFSRKEGLAALAARHAMPAIFGLAE
jgi:hypothetical protein